MDKTVHGRGNRNGSYVYENMLNFIHSKKNANENYLKKLFLSSRLANISKLVALYVGGGREMNIPALAWGQCTFLQILWKAIADTFQNTNAQTSDSSIPLLRFCPICITNTAK